MSAPTFKIGDRVRSLSGRKGVVRHVDDNGTVHAVGAGWVGVMDPENLRPCPPMSPEARMVWHAMRAGAHSIGRYHWTSRGITYRVHKYAGDDIYLRVDIALPPLAEDEAGR